MKGGPLARKFRTFRSLFSQGKYPEIIEALFYNLREFGIYIQVNNLYSCDRLTLAPPQELKDFEVRSISAGSVSLLLPIENKEPKVFITRLQEYGDECRGVFYAHQLIGYAWLSTSVMRIPELEYERPLKKNEVYLYDVIIRKEWRHRGFYGLFLSQLFQELIPSGIIIYTSVEITNYKSKQSHTRSGFRKTGRGVFIKIGRAFKHRSVKLNSPSGKKLPRAGIVRPQHK